MAVHMAIPSRRNTGETRDFIIAWAVDGEIGVHEPGAGADIRPINRGPNDEQQTEGLDITCVLRFRRGFIFFQPTIGF